MRYCGQTSKAPPRPLAVVNVEARSPGDKASQLKKHKSDGVQRARSLAIPVRAADVVKQGQLVHRQVPFGNSSTALAPPAVAVADPRQRLWEQCWAVLHETTLYLWYA